MADHAMKRTWDSGNPEAVDGWVTWCDGCGQRPWPCDTEKMRHRAEQAESAVERLRVALEGLLRAGFRGDDFLTQNSVPMTATPGVRRAVQKARAALTDTGDGT